MSILKKIFVASTIFVLSLMMLNKIPVGSVVAEQKGEKIIKAKSIQLLFDEKHPEGSVDLKKIAAEELNSPPECRQATVICQVKSVSFDMKITKEWLKLDLRELNNYSYANTAPRIKHAVDKLEKGEIVILQETLARRGLLQYLDGGIVQERGFFGALTWMGLIRLAEIKGLSDKDPEFFQKLTNEANGIMDNMANNENYVNDRPLPREDTMIPKEGDVLYDKWKNYKYLSQLAKESKKVDPGIIPLDIGNDVNIDGFVNIERIK